MADHSCDNSRPEPRAACDQYIQVRVRICDLNDLALSGQPPYHRYFIESVKHKNCGVSQKMVDVHSACVRCGCLRQFRKEKVSQSCCPSCEADMQTGTLAPNRLHGQLGRDATLPSSVTAHQQSSSPNLVEVE